MSEQRRMSSREVRELRAQLGWTQQRLAREIGASTFSVNRWEKGTVPPGRMATLAMRLLARRARENA